MTPSSIELRQMKFEMLREHTLYQLGKASHSEQFLAERAILGKIRIWAISLGLIDFYVLCDIWSFRSYPFSCVRFTTPSTNIQKSICPGSLFAAEHELDMHHSIPSNREWIPVE